MTDIFSCYKIEKSKLQERTEEFTITLGAKEYQCYSWNFLLVAITYGSKDIVQSIFENLPNFHHVNSLSKPYSIKQQKSLVLNYKKVI
jgi:hypothetical protein